MIIYVNNKNEIKDVNTTDNKNLTPLEIKDEWNPFSNWPVAKICCYRVTVSDGIVTMMTPYVDSKLMGYIAKLGSKDEAIESDVTNTQIGLFENYSQTMAISDELTNTQLGLLESYNMAASTAEEVTNCQLALLELYNIITGGM